MNLSSTIPGQFTKLINLHVLLNFHQMYGIMHTFTITSVIYKKSLLEAMKHTHVVQHTLVQLTWSADMAISPGMLATLSYSSPSPSPPSHTH